jgi:GNAT superfamily N-acetyltransferase
MIEDNEGFVATVDRAIVGRANPDKNEVDQLYVEPVAGGQGVARCLYEAVEQLALSNGLVELRAVASLRAEPICHRSAFRELGRHDQIFNGQTFTVARITKNLGEAPETILFRNSWLAGDIGDDALLLGLWLLDTCR